MSDRPPLDAGMRTSIEGALEVVRKHDPGLHGLIHNLCRLAAWLDGHPERDDGIRSYYPGFETVVRTEELERLRAKLVEQDNQLAAAKPAMAVIEHAKKLVRENAEIPPPARPLCGSLASSKENVRD